MEASTTPSKPTFGFAPLSRGPMGTGFQAELCGVTFWLVTSPIQPEGAVAGRSAKIEFKESGCVVVLAP